MTLNLAAPVSAYPREESDACRLLTMLLDGQEVPEKELCSSIGRNYRSAIQSLRGARYLWRLINVTNEDGIITARKLDPRHLTGCQADDGRARLERLNELRAKSHQRALSENQRLERAALELILANERLAQFEKENAPAA